MAPWASIFGDFTKDAEAMYNNFRVYGTMLLLFMGKFSKSLKTIQKPYKILFCLRFNCFPGC